MEFSKYGLHKADGKTAVIAISISGNVLRTIECVEQAQHNGAYVIGITNNRQSRLAQVAKCPVCLDLDTEPTWTCGTLTYTGSLYALARTALALSSLKSPEMCIRDRPPVMLDDWEGLSPAPHAVSPRMRAAVKIIASIFFIIISSLCVEKSINCFIILDKTINLFRSVSLPL